MAPPPACSLTVVSATCRHCHAGKPFRRGLCPGCYADRLVRERYPSTSRFGPAPRRPIPPGRECVRCRGRKANRPRGLCWSCYHLPGVKDLYPSTSKYARRGVGNFTGNAPVAPRPTCFAPGTPEKVAVLAERARDGVALWHPLDARFEGDPRPVRFPAGDPAGMEL